jgi:hypothetical protein
LRGDSSTSLQQDFFDCSPEFPSPRKAPRNRSIKWEESTV